MDLPTCTILRLAGNTVNYSLISCPNVQILKLWPDGDRDADGDVPFAEFKPLHDFILNRSRLQELTIFLHHHVGLDPLIHFVFYGACEQGVWSDIMSVEVRVFVDEDLEEDSEGPENEYDYFFSQMVGRQQHYEEQWAEFTVTRDRGPDQIILHAYM